MVNDYVSLSLDPVIGVHKKSYRRTWNQLSRLQRSLIYLLLFFLILFILYIINNGKSKTGVKEFPKINEVPATQPLYIPENTIRQRIHPKELPVEIARKIPKGELESNLMGYNEKEYRITAETTKKNLEEMKNNVINVDSMKTVKKFKGPSNEKQIAVVDAFKHAWKGYKTFAWGHDMLKPISKSYQDWFSLGLTIVDALDTMLIMNLEDHFLEARDWVNKSLTFFNKKDVNLFEVTIRVLGGLLSAYHLSNDVMFLEKATDLGTRLLPCFNTNSGVPYSDVNLETLQAHSPKWSPDSSTSEVTTIQLEFRDLSRSTGNMKFEESASRVSAHVHQLEKTEGLVPIFINANTGDFRPYSTITLGARGDSYYEYLLKQWIQTGQTINYLKEDYIKAINGVQKLLVRRTPKNKLLFVGELLSGGKDFKPKMDHLTCYLPGTLALGVLYGMPEEHMDLAEELLYACYQTYAYQPTFLAAEISYFNIQDNSESDIYVKANDAHNLLRPEFVESLWVMYQITGNITYQDWGWQIFQAFEKHTKVANGYTSIGNVKSTVKTRPKDIMESFFLGETLKYLYLLLGNDRHELSLKEFVLNTEAHPLPIYAS